jgi:hypothetical protein
MAAKGAGDQQLNDRQERMRILAARAGPPPQEGSQPESKPEGRPSVPDWKPADEREREAMKSPKAWLAYVQEKRAAREARAVRPSPTP